MVNVFCMAATTDLQCIVVVLEWEVMASNGKQWEELQS